LGDDDVRENSGTRRIIKKLEKLLKNLLYTPEPFNVNHSTEFVEEIFKKITENL
jgi:hypothetical protein